MPVPMLSTPAHLINGQGNDAEEASLALGDSALGAVHERADRLAQRPLAVALAEHLLRKCGANSRKVWSLCVG